MTKRLIIYAASLFYRPKGDKWYEPLGGDARTCSVHGGRTRRGVRGIRGPNKGKAFCVRCYLLEIPEKVDRAMARAAVPLFFAAILALAVAIATAAGAFHYVKTASNPIVRYEFGSELKIDEGTKEVIVGHFFDLLRAAGRDDISRGQIRVQVEEALRTGFPLIILAIMYRESLFDPAALGRMVVVNYKGKKIKMRARGNTQVLPTWTDDLIAAGIISEESDLHDPVLGVRAGEWVFCRHLEDERGDILMAVKAYVGSSKPDPLNVKYVRDVFETYGELRLLLMSVRRGKEA